MFVFVKVEPLLKRRIKHARKSIKDVCPQDKKGEIKRKKTLSERKRRPSSSR